MMTQKVKNLYIYIYIFGEKRGIRIALNYLYVIPVCVQLIYVLDFCIKVLTKVI
jgi:hypothetical protein